MSVGVAPETESRASVLKALHPSGWVAVVTLLAALFAHLFVDTEYLIANLEWWWWPLLVGSIAMSAWHSGLNRRARAPRRGSALSRKLG